jgi:ribonuclease HII
MIYEELYTFDEDMRNNYGVICGVDEAGRGPLAGPVSCAAVILDSNERYDWLTDSKKVSEARREALYEKIVATAKAYSVVLIDNETIDEINILEAAMLGMKRAIEALEIKPDAALVDGNAAPKTDISCLTVIKGDSKSASIAAASILAKVTRDRFMRGLDEEFPQYGFAKHKGYPTRAHYEAIDKYGITAYHRRSFLKGRV